jgi:hypothetical protein
LMSIREFKVVVSKAWMKMTLFDKSLG